MLANVIDSGHPPRYFFLVTEKIILRAGGNAGVVNDVTHVKKSEKVKTIYHEGEEVCGISQVALIPNGSRRVGSECHSLL